MTDQRERLRHALEAIARIERYAAHGRQTFEADELVQSWIVRHLQIVGEVARALPESITARAPEVPWAKIIGMRHILVDDYFGIDTDIVWDVAERDLPGLKRQLEHLLAALQED